MRAVMIAILIASSSGCALAHERPNVDAAVTPDAFVGRDAHDAYFTPDAYVHDSNFPPVDQCPLWNPMFHGGGHIDLERRACAVGQPECQVFEVDTTMETAYWAVRCAPQSTVTVVRATLLSASSTSNGVEMCPGGGMCTTTDVIHVGDVVDLTGSAGTLGGPNGGPGEFEDLFHFSGAGARFQVEACAIGSCP